MLTILSNTLKGNGLNGGNDDSAVDGQLAVDDHHLQQVRIGRHARVVQTVPFDLDKNSAWIGFDWFSSNLVVGPVIPQMGLIVGKGAEGQVVLGKVPSRPLAAESAAAHQGDHRAPLDLLLHRHLHVLLLLDLHDVPLLVLDGHHAVLFHLQVLFMELQVCESLHVQHLGTTED